jgi:hypothetical protein
MSIWKYIVIEGPLVFCFSTIILGDKKNKMPLMAYAFFTVEIIYIKWIEEQS